MMMTNEKDFTPKIFTTNQSAKKTQEILFDFLSKHLFFKIILLKLLLINRCLSPRD